MCELSPNFQNVHMRVKIQRCSPLISFSTSKLHLLPLPLLVFDFEQRKRAPNICCIHLSVSALLFIRAFSFYVRELLSSHAETLLYLVPRSKVLFESRVRVEREVLRGEKFLFHYKTLFPISFAQYTHNTHTVEKR